MSALSDRLKLALSESGKKKTDIWKACGVSSSAVSQWFNGAVKELEAGNLLGAAKVLGVNPDWLATGRGAMRSDDGAANTTPGPDLRGRVPIISWVQAGNWREAVDTFHPGGAEEWVNVTCPIKSHTFALRVQGDSMVNPHGTPSFPEGLVLIVEPEMDFNAGDFVVAKNGDDEVTFKQLVKDGGDWYLKPLNPQYPLKPLGTASIVGVVREAVMRFR